MEVMYRGPDVGGGGGRGGGGSRVGGGREGGRGGGEGGGEGGGGGGGGGRVGGGGGTQHDASQQLAKLKPEHLETINRTDNFRFPAQAGKRRIVRKPSQERRVLGDHEFCTHRALRRGAKVDR